MNKKHIMSLIRLGEKLTTEYKEASFALPKNIVIHVPLSSK